MRIGVLALQGDVEEHLAMLKKCRAAAARNVGRGGSTEHVEAVRVKKVKDVEAVDALIIPGGESTTIAKLMFSSGIAEIVIRRAGEGMPVWGTCAGLVLMAKKGDAQVKKTGQKLLELMDFEVERNAFGRQRESFEAELDVGGIKKFPAVFIRGPAIANVWGECKVLARFGGKIVAAEQGNFLATAFHPELSEDARVHEYFLNKLR